MLAKVPALLLLLLMASSVALAKEVRATIVYDDAVSEVLSSSDDPNQLWITTADLTRATRFELKPQKYGANDSQHGQIKNGNEQDLRPQGNVPPRILHSCPSVRLANHSKCALQSGPTSHWSRRCQLWPGFAKDRRPLHHNCRLATTLPYCR